MFNSAKYWDNRYATGGNSGDGSYTHLAEFKADIINTFIKTYEIRDIIDYGVGDGNQLKLLDISHLSLFTGLDVSPTVIDRLSRGYSDISNIKFLCTAGLDFSGHCADMVMSCDVIYHLIEDSIYNDYMKNLFSMAKKYVIIYAKDEDIHHCRHVRFRKFSDYISRNFPEWTLQSHIPNKYPQVILGRDNKTTSPSDFYIYTRI
jgi:hypothetical protein